MLISNSTRWLVLQEKLPADFLEGVIFAELLKPVDLHVLKSARVRQDIARQQVVGGT